MSTSFLFFSKAKNEKLTDLFRQPFLARVVSSLAFLVAIFMAHGTKPERKTDTIMDKMLTQSFYLYVAALGTYEEY